MKRRFRISVCLLTAMSMSSAAIALSSQPEGEPEIEELHPAPPDHEPPGPGDRRDNPRLGVEIQINPDALRARLMRSMERAQRIIDTHTAAIEKLDAGASPREVLAEIKNNGNFRDNQRMRPPTREHGGPPNGPGGLSPKEKHRLQTFLQENFPELWENFAPVAKLNPQAADRLLARMGPQIREILMLEEHEPELADIKKREMRAGLVFVEASRLYRKAKNTPNASDEEIQAAYERMREVAAERFDIQLEAKSYEISKLEARLNEFKSSVESAKDSRDAEVARMVEAAIKPPVKPKRDEPRPSRND
ncbi:MAG: hypothetical protein ACWA5W_02015 [Phycisphaerales bacterium]